METCWLKEGHDCISEYGSWDFYFLKTNQHVLNEKLYVQKGKDSIW